MTRLSEEAISSCLATDRESDEDDWTLSRSLISLPRNHNRPPTTSRVLAKEVVLGGALVEEILVREVPSFVS